MNKSKLLIYVISILFFMTVFSEILLLYQHFDLQKQFASLQKMQPLLRAAQSELALKEAEQQWQGLPLAKEADKDQAPYRLLFFFSLNDCGSCLDEEIVALNKLAQTVDNEKCRILALTQDAVSVDALKELAMIHRIRFDIAGADNPLFTARYNPDERSPLMLFGDVKSNRILYAFYPTPGRKSSDHFLPAVERFMQLTP